MDKLEMIKWAIKLNLEYVLADKKTLYDKNEYLNEFFKMDISDLSKILNLKMLPSLPKIIEIEQALNVSILEPIFPSKHTSVETYNKRNIILDRIKGLSGDKTVADVFQVEQGTSYTYNSIKTDSVFRDCIDTLLSDLQDGFKPIEEESNLKFSIRKRDKYISINLVPPEMAIGGLHLMFIRFYPKTPKLQLEFIVQNSQFRSQLEYINTSDTTRKNTFPKMETGSTDTTNVPRKKAGHQDFIEKGRPSLIFLRPLDKADIKQIVYLAKEVYYEQSKDDLNNDKDNNILHIEMESYHVQPKTNFKMEQQLQAKLAALLEELRNAPNGRVKAVEFGKNPAALILDDPRGFHWHAFVNLNDGNGFRILHEGSRIVYELI